MPVVQKTREIPQYDSEEAGSHDSEEEEDQYDPKQEQVCQIHDAFLKALANHTAYHEIPPLTPENQYATGKSNMTILHYLLSNQPYCKLPFARVRSLLDQLLNSDDKTVKEFLSLKDANKVTALSLAVFERRWDVLLHLLRHGEALVAAGVPSGEDNNNILHKIVLKRSLRNFRPMGATDEDLRDCIKLILSSNSKELITGRNKYGFTPLHLAVKFKSKAIPDGQLDLVSQLIDASPELFKIANKEGESPYLYRLRTAKINSTDDPIAFLMKNHYMHLDDRNEVVRNLYGEGGAELSMEIDLSEHRVYKFSRASLQNPSRHWKFENILRYVHFPEVHLEELPEDNNVTKYTRKRHCQHKSYDFKDEGIGRKDLKVIFNWLQHHCGVKKIIKVRVDDKANAPHSDQIIEESLKDLGIEVLDWFKYDLCSETILKAAPDVEEVYLYSSGTNAVLRSWSSRDGLRKLRKLKVVHIVLYQRLETYKRTKKMFTDFKGRLEEQMSGIDIKGRIERCSAPRGDGPGDGNSEIEGGSPQQTRSGSVGREMTIGPHRPDIPQDADSPSAVLPDRGRYEEVEMTYRHAWEGMAKVLGPEHPSTLDSMNTLGEILLDLRKYDEAEVIFRLASARREKALGTNHADTLRSIDNLGRTLHHQKKYKEAEVMFRSAQEGREKTLGLYDLDTILSAHGLAVALLDQKDYNRAEKMYRHALRGMEKTLGTDHPFTLDTIITLSETLLDLKMYYEAEVMCRRALACSERTLGPTHRNTLLTINNLGVALRNQKKHHGAEVMYRRALMGAEKTLGLDHRDTLMCLYNLARALHKQRKYHEAEMMHWRGLAGRERALGPGHTHTLRTILDLGEILYDQRKYDTAEIVYRRAVTEGVRTLGPSHRMTLRSTNRLEIVLQVLESRTPGQVSPRTGG